MATTNTTPMVRQWNTVFRLLITRELTSLSYTVVLFLGVLARLSRG